MTSVATASAPRSHRRHRRLIDRHFSGAGDPDGEREMRRHLVDCGPCRDHYERHLHLERVDPQGAVPAGERLARGLGLSTRRAPARGTGRRIALALAASAACAAAVVAIGLRSGPGELQPRGSSSAPGSQLIVYEVTTSGVRTAVSAVHSDSALAFGYSNIGRRQRVMVFAVDETRRVYWYHPAWDRPDDNPVAVEIQRDDAVHELTQAVRHRFSGRRLRVYGLFVDRAVSVREVEALVTGGLGDPRQQIQADLAGAGADLATLDLDLVGAP